MTRSMPASASRASLPAAPGRSGSAGSATRSTRLTICAACASAPPASRARCCAGSARRSSRCRAARSSRRCRPAPSTPASSSGRGTTLPSGSIRWRRTTTVPGPASPARPKRSCINAAAYDALPDDLKLIIKTVAMSAATRRRRTTRSTTPRRCASSRPSTASTSACCRRPSSRACPSPTSEIVQELLDDPDPMVREVMASYAKFRNLMAEYAPYGHAGRMNARTMPFPEA